MILHAAAARPPETLAAWAADPDATAVRTLLDLVRSGATALITGAAGTGKSTLLRLVSAELPGTPVLAPTGVAALLCGGQTIHSYFRLERGVQRPGFEEAERPPALYRSLRALIFDEVSMVRADVLDMIDAILRRARQSDAPFGGVQLLMFGDLLQLPPVLARHEAQAFKSLGYGSPHMFEASAMRIASPPVVVLDRVHRQQEGAFVEVLNSVRRGEANPAVLDRLNRRVLRAAAADGPASLTVATRRFMVEVLNQQRLNELRTPLTTYRGTRRGDFPASDLPVPYELQLRPGARVMFVRNDADGRWVNGTLGSVLDCRADHVTVARHDREGVCTVRPVSWDRYTYAINRASGEVERRLVGQYVQLPVVLGWAATVHKTQGLTLERVHVDLGRGAFAPGQTYVALSRCRTEAGLTLGRPIRGSDLQVDRRVLEYLEAGSGCAG